MTKKQSTPPAGTSGKQKKDASDEQTTAPGNRTKKRSKEDLNASPPIFDLRLYVAGQTPKSLTAITNLNKICEEHLQGQYRIKVIDLLVTPQLAQGDQILAIPTLVRKLPAPIKKVIGDLSSTEQVLVGLDIRPRK